MSAGEWEISASGIALRTVNSARLLMQRLVSTPVATDKPKINLLLGDPAAHGMLVRPPIMDTAMRAVLDGRDHDGYLPARGSDAACAAVATHFSRGQVVLTPDDVFLTSGCSGAIELAICVLCSENTSILVPEPGFPLYRTIAVNRRIRDVPYRLDPEKSWEVDLADLESKIDATTRAIIVINPSNPCGSLYSREHLAAIGALAARHGLPIIADEVYYGMAYREEEGSSFIPIADAVRDVPILSVGGLAKRFIVPGWRIGWVLAHDAGGRFRTGGVYDGLISLARVLNGPCALVQGVLPAVLGADLTDYFAEMHALLRANSDTVHTQLSGVPGLTPVRASGAMYVLVRVTLPAFGVADDLELSTRLVQDEALLVFPGSCFGAPGTLRIVLCASSATTAGACCRLKAWAERNYKGV